MPKIVRIMDRRSAWSASSVFSPKRSATARSRCSLTVRKWSAVNSVVTNAVGEGSLSSLPRDSPRILPSSQPSSAARVASEWFSRSAKGTARRLYSRISLAVHWATEV